MTRIGLLSDTHGWLDKAIFKHFDEVNEIWHAGDWGNSELLDELMNFKPVRGVFGNIDDNHLRNLLPEENCFRCEEVQVAMLHIAGYPGRYKDQAKALIKEYRPQLFITGHSHILKILYDHNFEHLHIKPGAAGQQGWHQQRTIVRFSIDGKEVKDCEIIELGKRGSQ
jgi:putative phosphoesterase